MMSTVDIVTVTTVAGVMKGAMTADRIAGMARAVIDSRPAEL